METKESFGLIWDQTGVLYKYGRGNVSKSFREVFKRHKIDFHEEIFSEKYRGTSLANQIKMWKEDLGFDMPLSLKQLSEESAEIQYKNIDKEQERDSALIRLLDDLKKRKVPMIVATSSTRGRALKILNILDLSHYFIDVVSCDDVVKHEPATDTIYLASQKMNLPLTHCIVIEDAASGISAAKKAGCKTIGYAVYSEDQYKSLVDAGADKVIRDFKEIDYSVLAGLCL